MGTACGADGLAQCGEQRLADAITALMQDTK